MFVRIITTVNQFPKTILLVVLALSAFFFVQARDGLFDSQTGRLRINSTIEPFIDRDSGAYQQFLDARKAFGSEEVVVIALHNTERKTVGLEFLLTLADLKSEIDLLVLLVAIFLRSSCCYLDYEIKLYQPLRRS